MPASSASVHSTLVQAALGIGRKSTRCCGSTTVCDCTWAANGVSLSTASTGRHGRRAGRTGCKFLVIVTISRARRSRLRRMLDTRSLVLVAGSGRSGTSLFSGIMKRLGYTVPGPEVPADETNPRGFAESQWVVDFHMRLLRRAGVHTADARPAAWARTDRVGLDAAVVAELRGWLAGHLSLSGHPVV